MNELREQLVETYADHYARTNASVDARRMPARDLRMHDRTFGMVLKQMPRPAKILDLGCGVGFLLHWLSRQPGVLPVGVDASPGQVEIVRRTFPDFDITCLDGLDYLRQNPDSLDGIFCTDVLEHIPGVELCIEWVQAARRTAAQRFLCVPLPNGASLTAGFSRYIDLTHERSFTEISMLQLLDAGGLKDSRILPICAGDWKGAVRQWIEHRTHRIVYRICGQGSAHQFTTNVCAVGYRRG